MDDHIKLLCHELVIELVETALNNYGLVPTPVEGFLQADALKKGDAQTPPTTDPTTPPAFQEPRTEGPLKPQFFAKRPAVTSLLPQAKVKVLTSLQDLIKCIHTARWQGESVRVRASKGLSSS